MTQPKTIQQMRGVDPVPPPLSKSALIIIDAQQEYQSGPLALPGLDAAVAETAALLDRARALGTPVLHIVHQGSPGGAFDLDAPRGAILPALAPRAGEPVIRKTRASAFADTDLQLRLAALGTPPLVLVGFMTHNCVAGTAHSASALGMTVTIVNSASATRALPLPNGGAVDADTLHQTTLSGLSDTIARIVPQAGDIPDH